MNRRNFAKTAALGAAGLSLGLGQRSATEAFEWDELNKIYLYVVDSLSNNEIAMMWFDPDCNPKDIKTSIQWLFAQYGPSVKILSSVPTMPQEDAARRVITKWIDTHRYSDYQLDDVQLPYNILQTHPTPQPDPSP